MNQYDLLQIPKRNKKARTVSAASSSYYLQMAGQLAAKQSLRTRSK